MDEVLERILVGVGADPDEWPDPPEGTPAELLDAWVKACESLDARWDKLLADAPKLSRRLNRWRDDNDARSRIWEAYQAAVADLPPAKRKAEGDRLVELIVGMHGDGEAS